MKREFRIGDKVHVLRSDYTGIGPDDIGIIKHLLPDKDNGYGVEFTMVFPQSVSHVKPVEETRTIYFVEKNLKLHEDSINRPVSK